LDNVKNEIARERTGVKENLAVRYRTGGIE